MNRKEFIEGAVSAIVTFPSIGAIAGAGDVVSGKRLPTWALEQIAEGVARFRAWKGMDDVVSFPVMTDCHSKYYALSRHFLEETDTDAEVSFKTSAAEANLSFEGEPNWTDPKVHILFMRHIAHEVGADFMADLGDHDFEYFVFKKPMPMSVVEIGMRAYRKLYEGEALPTLFARGNHDHSKGRITDEKYGETFNRSLNVGKNCALNLSSDGTFGWLDLQKKKFRVIFLNTSRGFKNGLFQEELQFLADSLSSTPDGWQTILLEHIPVMTMQFWHRSMNRSLDPNMRVAYAMLDAYANRRGDFVVGWNDIVAKQLGKTGMADKNVCPLCGGGSVRFCFKDVKSIFAGAIFGHEHVADFIHYGNVPLVTRPGYGTILPDCIAGEMVDVKKGGPVPQGQMLIDLIAFKPARREAHVFRFGLGGARSDLEYRY